MMKTYLIANDSRQKGVKMNSDFVETTDPMVNHPNHYQTQKGFEVFDVIEAALYNIVGELAVEAWCTGNVIKYIMRWKKKNGLQDLHKCQWYLNKLIEHVTTKTAKG